MRKKNSMTQDRWQKEVFVAPMLYCLRDLGKNCDRKLRLFAVACCRGVWHRLEDVRSRIAVQVAERYAEGLASLEELDGAVREAISALDEICTADGYDVQEVLRKAPFSFARGAPAAIRWACSAAWTAAENAERSAWAAEGVANSKELAANCNLLRCIFGNPFRPPPAIQPAWLAWNGGVVVGLARAIYEERRFDDMPVLADALEEAGCGDEEVLGHLRGLGPHARGCHVLGAVLGRV